MSRTHYRKAFKSPYLSSADIVGPTVLTISRVALEPDKTNKTKDEFNTAYFAEKEIRPGERLKPMILNVHNSEVVRDMCGSPFIDDWSGVVTVYVDHNVKFGRDTVEGLRLKPGADVITEKQLGILKKLLSETGSKVEPLLRYYKIDKLESLQASQYKDAHARLMKKKGAKSGAA